MQIWDGRRPTGLHAGTTTRRAVDNRKSHFSLTMRRILLSALLMSPVFGAAFSGLPLSLPDGTFVIRKTRYAPVVRVGSAAEAQRYLSNDTERAPITEFFELRKSGESFSVLQLERVGEGFAPNGGFFVGITRREAWAFEQSSINRHYTRVTRVLGVLNEKDLPGSGGPVGGLLKTGYVAARQLASLGVNNIEWSHARPGKSAGTTSWGERVLVEEERREDGSLALLRCLLSESAERDTVRYEVAVSYEKHSAIPKSTTIYRIVADTPKKFLEYEVFSKKEAVADEFIRDYWKSQQTIATERYEFKQASSSTEHVMHDGARSVVVGAKEQIAKGVLQERRWLIIFAMGLATLVSVITFMYPGGKRPT